MSVSFSEELDFRFGNIRKKIEEQDKGRIPRIKRLLALSHYLHRLLDADPSLSQLALSKMLPITNERLIQILNLAFLSPKIQLEILDMPNVTKGKDPVFTKDVEKISRKVEWKKQEEMWKKK